MYHRVLRQQRRDKNKIYSLHEPQVYCVSKGKDHKKHEFGAKASVVMTKTHGVIVGAVSHPKNIYDGHTLPEVLNQVQSIQDQRPKRAIVDRGYRGSKQVEGTQIMVPQAPPKKQSRSKSSRLRKLFRRRTAIEPVNGHLKHDFRMVRNRFKGSVGDSINLMLAAAAWNHRKWMREVLICLLQILRVSTQNHSPTNHTNPLINLSAS